MSLTSPSRYSRSKLTGQSSFRFPPLLSPSVLRCSSQYQPPGKSEWSQAGLQSLLFINWGGVATVTEWGSFVPRQITRINPSPGGTQVHTIFTFYSKWSKALLTGDSGLASVGFNNKGLCEAGPWLSTHIQHHENIARRWKGLWETLIHCLSQEVASDKSIRSVSS